MKNLGEKLGVERSEWRRALVHGLLVAATVLVLFCVWFGVRDRYIVFLYFHDMGPRFPDTAPFSAVTASRYWMAGLVAAGIVMCLYVGACLLQGRLRRGYRPPAWWHVWLVAAAPVAVGIPLVVMSVNVPRLPWLNAVQVTLAAIVGLGLAVAPAGLAARQPGRFFLLTVDGGAAAGVLFGAEFVLRVLEMAQRGAARPLAILGVWTAGSLLLLLAMSAVYARRPPPPPSRQLAIAGCCVAYLLLPAVHHLGFTDGYYYITTADNFFADTWPLQIVAWVVTASVILAITWLRAGHLPGSSAASRKV
jgi:hypothetical protein